jgi:hypothetical protein
MVDFNGSIERSLQEAWVYSRGCAGVGYRYVSPHPPPSADGEKPKRRVTKMGRHNFADYFLHCFYIFLANIGLLTSGQMAT